MSNPDSSDDRALRRARPRILQAVTRMIEGRGVLTMEAIAAEAGVTRRTLYNHFANVDELCRAACAPLVARCVAAMPAADCDGRPLRQRLHGVAVDVIRFQRNLVHARLRRIAFIHALTAPGLARCYEEAVTMPLRERVASRLGYDTGSLQTTEASHILTMLEFASHLEYLVCDLSRSGPGSVVVDMLIDRLRPASLVRHAA